MARWEMIWDFVQFSAVWHLPAHCKKVTVIPKFCENKKMGPRVFKVPFREVLLPQMTVHWGPTGLGQVPGSLTVCQRQEHPLLCEPLGCSCFLGGGRGQGERKCRRSWWVAWDKNFCWSWESTLHPFSVRCTFSLTVYGAPVMYRQRWGLLVDRGLTKIAFLPSGS